MRKSRPPMPRLVFGQERAVHAFDLQQMQQRVQSVTKWVSEFDTLDKNTPFQHISAHHVTKQFGLLAVSSSPTVMKVSSPECTLAIPLAGHLHGEMEGQKLAAFPGGQALFYPPGRRHTEGGNNGVLLVSVSEARLRLAAMQMLAPREAAGIGLHIPRVLDTRFGSVNFKDVILQQCTLIDQFNDNPALLENFSLEDNIVKSIVMMLAPEKFLAAQPRRKSGEADQKLLLITDFIMAHLDTPINLELLEQISGLSARVIQLKFKHRFGCSPMRWISEQRLDLAHYLLSNPVPNTTVSLAAATCGFSNMGDFSRRYAIRHGKLPSETLRNAYGK